MPTIKNFIQRNVIFLYKDDTIYKAVDEMSYNGISCVVVVDNEDNTKIIGILTRRDVLEKVLLNKLNVEKMKIRQIMSSPVITIKETDKLINVINLMNEKNVKQLPVTKKNKIRPVPRGGSNSTRKG